VNVDHVPVFDWFLLLLLATYAENSGAADLAERLKKPEKTVIACIFAFKRCGRCLDGLKITCDFLNNT